VKRELQLGTVLDSADPSAQGGAQLQINEILDGAALDLPDFVPGRYPFAGNGEGFYYAPQRGALLEVEVEEDPEDAVEELSPRWVGMLYSDEDQIPAEFRSDPVNRGGIKFGEEVFLQDKVKALTALISAALRLGEEGATEAVMRGDAWNSAWDTWVSALDQYLSAEVTCANITATNFQALATASAVPPLTPLQPLFQALATAWTNFGAAIPGFQTATSTRKGQKQTWLSTKVKTE